jgi:uncharacterized protein
MEARISLITLGVEDLERARRFYDTLGFPIQPESTEDVVFLSLGPLWLSLYPRQALAQDAGVDPRGEGFRRITLAHNVRSADEVDAVLAEAETAGGRIVKAAREASWGGYSGYFSDPDGFLWEVAWNPNFWIE